MEVAMSSVYVAGPVIRKGAPVPNLAHDLYHRLERLVIRFPGMEIALPMAEGWLEEASPGDFVEEIRRRIDSSDFVITVLDSNDPSGPAETVVAALAGKRQLI